MAKFIESQRMEIDGLGVVRVRVHPTARKFVARWKADGLHVTVPRETPVAEFQRVMEGWREKLLSLKPEEKLGKYSFGFGFETDDWGFVIVENPSTPAGYAETRRRQHADKAMYEICLAPGYDFRRPEADRFLSKVISRLAHAMGKQLLPPQAREEAGRLGLMERISAFDVGYGRQRLGFCTRQGRISLSSRLMFLPRALRRGTITHELAHLTHFDHSPAFYALWDAYLGFPHLVYKSALRSTPFPTAD